MGAIVCTALLIAATVSASNVSCKRNAFPWYGECWHKLEGKKFAADLSRHGTSPLKFKKKWPQLAAVFRQPWPPIRNWEAYEKWALHQSLQDAARVFRVSYSWLHNCMHSEGGHYGWPPNWAGAGGPFQFLHGTFLRMSPQAWLAANRLGIKIPTRYRDWYSNVGQTWTAAWAFSAGLSREWFGAGC